MLELMRVSSTDRCLEIGTGSGYAAAVLSRIAAVVYTVERHPVLARSADERLRRLGYVNVHVSRGNGSLGLPDEAPFDAILFSAGAPDVPSSLLEQLGDRGRLVGPVGQTPYAQELVRVTRRAEGDYLRDNLGAVQFLPLVGVQGWHEPEE
jgi:protein-L-isoaspartate(D-aspartate) O-methyltransferase